MKEKIAKIIVNFGINVLSKGKFSQDDIAKVVNRIFTLLRREGWLHKDDKVKGIWIKKIDTIGSIGASLSTIMKWAIIDLI